MPQPNLSLPIGPTKPNKRRKDHVKPGKADAQSKDFLSQIKAKPTTKLDKNCLTCRRYAKCNNKKKRFDFYCERYRKLRTKTPDKTSSQIILPEKATLIKLPQRHLLRPTFKISDAEESSRKFEQLTEDALLEFQTTQLPPDLRIDDRDIPLARNIIEFCSKEFLNTELFGKQIQVVLHTMADYCANPKCTDIKYVHNIPKEDKIADVLEKVTVLNHGKCPKCKGNRAEFYNKGMMKIPVEIALLWGQRSGKTAVARVLLVYTYHRYLKLQNAGVVFGLLEEEILTSFLVAITFAQAKSLLYDGIYNYLTKSPWYRKYHDLMDHYANKFGEELYKVKETFAMYRHRKLFIAVRGPDMRSLRGVTAFASAIDEIGLFINSKGQNSQNAIKINGEEVYTSVSNAFLTLRPVYRKLLREGNYSLPPPLLINTSSPTSKKDMIVRLYKQGKTSPDIYSSHLATWEANPNISREDLQGKFNNNYAKALRDYGAVPPNSASPFIDKMKQLKPLCNAGVHNNLNFRPTLITMASGAPKLSGKIIFRRNETTIPHIMCFDAGISNNSFAIVTGYFDEKMNIPVFDGFVEVIPTSETPISFTAMLDDLMTPIIKKMNVKFVASDRWQNLKFFSDIETEHEIETAAYPLKYPKFLEFKEDVDGANFAIPMPEVPFKAIDDLAANDYPNSFLYKPVAHFLSQCLTVQDAVKDVIKGDGMTDDIFRALVLAHSYLTDPEYQDLFIGSEEHKPMNRALGAVGSSSGATGSTRDVNGIGTVSSRGS